MYFVQFCRMLFVFVDLVVSDVEHKKHFQNLKYLTHFLFVSVAHWINSELEI